jgi:hypothetical protein
MTETWTTETWTTETSVTETADVHELPLLVEVGDYEEFTRGQDYNLIEGGNLYTFP